MSANETTQTFEQRITGEVQAMLGDETASAVAVALRGLPAEDAEVMAAIERSRETARNRLAEFHPHGTPLLEVLDDLCADNEGTPEAWLWDAGLRLYQQNGNDPTGSIVMNLANLMRYWRERENEKFCCTSCGLKARGRAGDTCPSCRGGVLVRNAAGEGAACPCRGPDDCQGRTDCGLDLTTVDLLPAPPVGEGPLPIPAPGEVAECGKPADGNEGAAAPGESGAPLIDWCRDHSLFLTVTFEPEGCTWTVLVEDEYHTAHIKKTADTLTQASADAFVALCDRQGQSPVPTDIAEPTS